MRARIVGGFVAMMSLIGASAPATDFSTRIVDGLGRPVPDADVMLYVFGKDAKGQVAEVSLGKFHSDTRGEVTGKYNGASVQKDDAPLIQIRKDGYANYDDTNTLGLKRTYVVSRKFDRKDVALFAHLEGRAQVDQLREFMVGHLDDKTPGPCPLDSVFGKNGSCHVALLALIDDPKVGKTAAAWLAGVAMPEDMARIVSSVPVAGTEFNDNRWLYQVVTGLIEPTTDTEWELLRHAASGDYHDGWVDYGAVIALRLNASKRSREILLEAAKKDPDITEAARAAVAYIDAGATSIADSDPVRAGKRAAKSFGSSGWQGNKPPRFSKDRSIAFIDCSYVVGRDLLVDTATFHRVDGVWRLRAMRETEQWLLGWDDPRVAPYLHPLHKRTTHN